MSQRQQAQAQAQQDFSIVYYYVPEDLDEPSLLNAFVIRKRLEEIRLPDITSEFPMPGVYHFRFRCCVQKNRPVWLDLNNTACKLPLSEDGKILMKVTRVSWSEPAAASAHDLNLNLNLKEELKAAATPPPPPAAPAPASASRNLIGFETIVDNPKPAPPPPPPSQLKPEKTTAESSPLEGDGLFAAAPSEGSLSPEKGADGRASLGSANVSCWVRQLLNLEGGPGSGSPPTKGLAGGGLLLEGLDSLKFD